MKIKRAILLIIYYISWIKIEKLCVVSPTILQITLIIAISLDYICVYNYFWNFLFIFFLGKLFFIIIFDAYNIHRKISFLTQEYNLMYRKYRKISIAINRFGNVSS